MCCRDPEIDDLRGVFEIMVFEKLGRLKLEWRVLVEGISD